MTTRYDFLRNKNISKKETLCAFGYIKNIKAQPGTSGSTCNPSYLGCRDQEHMGSKPLSL
jgi:hypothetical protein